MELQTIAQVSKLFQISTRTLRYYEQIGLIKPTRREGSAYRIYDAADIARLRQIVILRKLRIPLKQIQEILTSSGTEQVVAEFQRALSGLETEIAALSTIKSILETLLEKLRLRREKLALLDDEQLLRLVSSLAVAKPNPKEEKTMKDLNQADEKLSRLTDRDVRIVYLPPATVAAIHCVGAEPETKTGDLLFAFIRAHDLPRRKPDFRHFGFNHPNGVLPDGSDHGFERWVTIPEDLEVAPPFVKKTFPGGLYGAHMIPMGAFDEWQRLFEWGRRHEKYEIAWGNPTCMSGFLEEHLDAMHHYLWSHEMCDRQLQLDLLLPIREKAPDET